MKELTNMGSFLLMSYQNCKPMISLRIHMVIIIKLLFLSDHMIAQRLDADDCESIVVAAHVEVTACKSIGDNEYYYLPTNLRFAETKHNDISFSFIKFQDKETSGSILHFLITWGLTSWQFQKAKEQLRDKKGIQAKLMGAVIPDVKNDVDGFVIEGTSKLVDILNRSMVHIGKATPMAHTKIAASFQLNQEDTWFLDSALANNQKDLKNTYLTLVFYLNYPPESYRTYKLKKNFYELLNHSL